MKKALFTASLLTSLFMTAQITHAEVDAARQNELSYFVKHDCGSCHGMTLKGGLGPALTPELLSLKPKEFLVTTIMEGRKNTAMPPWKSMLSQGDAVWITEQLLNGSLQQTDLAKGQQANDTNPRVKK